jgi:hypothetical protein
VTANQALMLANYLRHKVAVLVARSSQMSLIALAAQSFRTQATGQLEGTAGAQERNQTPWTSILFFMSSSTRRSAYKGHPRINQIDNLPLKPRWRGPSLF